MRFQLEKMMALLVQAILYAHLAKGHAALVEFAVGAAVVGASVEQRSLHGSFLLLYAVVCGVICGQSLGICLGLATVMAFV